MEITYLLACYFLSYKSQSSQQEVLCYRHSSFLYFKFLPIIPIPPTFMNKLVGREWNSMFLILIDFYILMKRDHFYGFEEIGLFFDSLISYICIVYAVLDLYRTVWTFSSNILITRSEFLMSIWQKMFYWRMVWQN